MIYLNNKELENLHIGEQEIQRVLLGESLIWENNRIVNLGSGKTWNIQNLFPSLYSRLTADNFFFLSFNNVSESVRVTVQEGGSDRLWIYGGLTKSYNPSTGVLNLYPYLNSQSANLTAVMVTKPEKLTYVGTGTSFNVRNLFPNDYQNMTANNFLVKTLSHWNGGGANGIVCNEVRNYAGTFSANDLLSFSKSYNPSTGQLTIYAKDNGGTDNATSWNRNSNCVVYGTKKTI